MLRRRPLRLLGRAAFIASRCYGPRKTLAEDVRTFDRAVYLARLLEKRGITHVHAPWADRQAFIALVAARLAGASFSLNLRAHEVHSRHYAFALTEKIAAARFAVTNSRYNHGRLIALAGPVARDRVRVIYNGLDLERFEPGPSGGSDPTPRLLSVGRLVQQKGFDQLLEACALLRDRGVDFRCDIIGGAAEPAETATAVCLRIQQRRLDLEGRLRFLGALPLSRVLAALDEADVFVLPCVVTPHGGRDVTPNALLEAMAMRRAVVSTPVGAIPELVDDGVNGILVPPGDAAALADAIDRLLADAPLRRRLGEAARRKIEERFDIRRNVARYAELFRDAVR
jgi:glycosyltransferase involved in cell wall biosynthesis